MVLFEKWRAQGWECEIFYESKIDFRSIKTQYVQLMYVSYNRNTFKSEKTKWKKKKKIQLVPFFLQLTLPSSEKG